MAYDESFHSDRTSLWVYAEGGFGVAYSNPLDVVTQILRRWPAAVIDIPDELEPEWDQDHVCRIFEVYSDRFAYRTSMQCQLDIALGREPQIEFSLAELTVAEVTTRTVGEAAWLRTVFDPNFNSPRSRLIHN